MNNTKPIAYIHVGLEKTGTTTLQEFAYHNRALLKQDNIYYPDSPGIKNHTDLPAYAYDKNLNDLAIRKNIVNANERIYFRDAFKNRFTKEIEPIQKEGMNLLVSSEHLSSRVGDENEVRILLSLFTDLGYRPRIIIYLRRQDQLLLSTYSTWVKCGATEPLNLDAYKRKRYDYLGQLKLWENTVGQENIIVGLFDKARLLNGDLIEDFCDKIGINHKQYELPAVDYNQSLGPHQLEFMRSFNEDFPELIDGEKNPIRGDIVSAMESFTDGQKAIMPDTMLKTIEAHFKNDNEQIQKRYFPEMKTSLFSEPKYAGKTPANNQQALSIEQAQKISKELWKFQQTRVNKLNQTYRDQRRKIEKLEDEIKQLKRKLL